MSVSPLSLQPSFSALNPCIENHEADGVHRELVDFRKRLEEPQGDYVGIFSRLKELDSELKHTGGAEAATFQNEVSALMACIGTEPVKTVVKEQEKWVKAGFDRALLKSDPEAVHFAVSTKLAFTIAMFDTSAHILEGERLTIQNRNGVAFFKVEGEWLPYAAFKDKIVYSEVEKKFLGWNFIHPLGFVNSDWADYDRVYPVATLKNEAYRAAWNVANTFWTKKQPEVDPGVQKPCILQVLTTGRNLLPPAWWANNFREHFPEHASLRLITPNGDVYSFGTKMRIPDEEFLCCREHYMGTGLSNVPVPDYEESRNSDDRTMVSLTVSEARAKGILDFVSRANKGISFNFARQNCIRFAETVLRLAGMNMSTKITGLKAFSHLIPRLSDIPMVGTGLSRVAGRIVQVARAIFHGVCCVVQAVLPKSLWKIGEDAVVRLGEKIAGIADIALNCLSVWVLGAHTSIVPEHQPVVPEVETFRTAISAKDLFNPQALSKYYSTQLKEWMHEQSTVRVIQKPDHGFRCFISEV